MAHDPQIVVSSSFETRPNTGTPTGTAAETYGTIAVPTDGTTMAVLSNGEARVPADSGYVAGRDNNLDGSDVRSAFDVTVLRVVLAVPANANCLAVDFDFFSQDFGPPASDSPNYFDAFLAELDPSSPWSVTGGLVAPTTTAPANFALDGFGRIVDVNQENPGETGYNGTSLVVNATGTAYLGALGFATAQTPVSPGSHTLDLSILDRGDGRYDSAVLLDALRVFRSVEGGCPGGLAFPGALPPVATLDAPADGSSTNDATPDLSGTTTAPDNTVSVKLYAGGGASGAPLQTLTGSGSGGSWHATAAALAPGTYSAQASAGDGAGNEGLSKVHAFTVLAPPGGAAPPPGGGDPLPLGATNGDDLLNGTPGVDLICGLFGNDTINGLAGNDTLYGDACLNKGGVAQDGNDRMNGGRGNDKLYGAGGADVLSGGSGNDSLIGGKGKNSYSGGAGNDTISAANRVKERINCGAGKKDRVTADRRDKLRGCEKVRRRGR